MLVAAAAALVLLFGLVFMGRVAGARRAALMARWPTVLLALAAALALWRGPPWLAVALMGAALLSWLLPAPARRREATSRESEADREARRLLGVSADATEAEIRAAYRTRIAAAHPDRGGRHADAARLTAARDRLLRKFR